MRYFLLILLFVLPVFGQATLVSDNFEDSNGTALSNHTPDTDAVGGGWFSNTHTISDTDPISGSTSIDAGTGENWNQGAFINFGQSDATISIDYRVNTDRPGAFYGVEARLDTVNAEFARRFIFLGFKQLSGTIDTLMIAEVDTPTAFSDFERLTTAPIPEDLTIDSVYTVTATLEGTSVSVSISGPDITTTEESTTTSWGLSNTDFGFVENSGSSGSVTLDNFNGTEAAAQSASTNIVHRRGLRR